ncbi:MAG: hypothetical protein DI570_28605 [Phenylobacterium zucineum]|nr:MAG: hypothetical protein DI570_28605 [Phenylobacterium zucineum]
MDFADKMRVLVSVELAAANRDPERLTQVIDHLAELLGMALVVAYRDDRGALDRASTALEGIIHGHAVLKLEALKALGLDDLRE